MTSNTAGIVLGGGVPTEPAPLPTDLAAAHAMILAERGARQRAEGLVSAATLEIERLKLLLAKARRERFGASSERSSRLIDQLELQLAELEESVAEDEAAAELGRAAAEAVVREHARQRPGRRPLPANLPRERVVVPPPSCCPCCGGSRLAKVGEVVTETLDVVPRRWFVKQTVREKFTCRDCERVSEPPAPIGLRPIPRSDVSGADRARHPARPRGCQPAGWSHARRPFYELADLARTGKGPPSPLALEAVRQIDAIFAHER